MTTDTRKALAEKETFAQAQRREREERFRKVLADNPEMTTVDIGERLGMGVHEVNRWCDRLGIPRRSSLEGLWKLDRPQRKRVRR